MSISPSPEHSEQSQPAAQEPGAARQSNLPIIALAVVMVLGMGGLFLYSKGLSDRLDQTQSALQASLDSQSESLNQLVSRLDQTDLRHTELQDEVGAASQRLGSTQTELRLARQAANEIAREQKESDEQLASRLGQLQQEQAGTRANLGNLSTDVVGVKGEVKNTQAELEKTRSELQRVMGDLGVQSDLIARTRGDLDALRLRGDREYIEFDLKKASKRQRFGTVQLELKKTDEKRQKYTVNLVADDKTIEKKDKNAFEPVQFYQTGYRSPTELVVQQILKDRIVGYISSPRVRDVQATATATAATVAR
jgi:chromosome segregation ATPase